MENLPSRAQGTQLTPSEITIAKIIVNVNQLVAFPISADELKTWARDISRLLPDLEPDRLQYLMDCFRTDAIPYDKNKGIQNIFNGLRKIEKKEGGGYKKLKTV